MTDDRLPRCRSESISASKADKVISPPLAISLSDFQNTSSRLTLVLRPPTSTDRFMIRDGITPPKRLLLRLQELLPASLPHQKISKPRKLKLGPHSKRVKFWHIPGAPTNGQSAHPVNTSTRTRLRPT